MPTVQQKSEGLALLLQFIFTGAGLPYIVMGNRATPFLIANSSSWVLALTGIHISISLLIWLVCVLNTIAPKITG
ncbi:MAG: hypothetical protein ACOYD0_03565 [Candidatus Nanopelagicales bacterium]